MRHGSCFIVPLFFCGSVPSTQILDVMFQVTGLQYAFSGSFFSDVNEAQTHAND